MIHEHVQVTNDTLSLDSTSILAQTPDICQVHFIQSYVTEPIKKLAHWALPRFEIWIILGTYKTLFHYSHVRNFNSNLQHQH